MATGRELLGWKLQRVDNGVHAKYAPRVSLNYSLTCNIESTENTQPDYGSGCGCKKWKAVLSFSKGGGSTSAMSTSGIDFEISSTENGILQHTTQLVRHCNSPDPYKNA